MTATLLVPRTPEEMLRRAVLHLEDGGTPQSLLDTASKWIEKWAELAARVENGEHLDGRSSIYTGETYAQARDRWATYRGLLLDHLRGTDGGGH